MTVQIYFHCVNHPVWRLEVVVWNWQREVAELSYNRISSATEWLTCETACHRKWWWHRRWIVSGCVLIDSVLTVDTAWNGDTDHPRMPKRRPSRLKYISSTHEDRLTGILRPRLMTTTTTTMMMMMMLGLKLGSGVEMLRVWNAWVQKVQDTKCL